MIYIPFVLALLLVLTLFAGDGYYLKPYQFLQAMEWRKGHTHVYYQYWPKPMKVLFWPFRWLYCNTRPDLLWGAALGKACFCGKTHWQLWYRNVVKREDYC